MPAPLVAVAPVAAGGAGAAGAGAAGAGTSSGTLTGAALTGLKGGLRANTAQNLATGHGEEEEVEGGQEQQQQQQQEQQQEPTSEEQTQDFVAGVRQNFENWQNQQNAKAMQDKQIQADRQMIEVKRLQDNQQNQEKATEQAAVDTGTPMLGKGERAVTGAAAGAALGTLVGGPVGTVVGGGLGYVLGRKKDKQATSDIRQQKEKLAQRIKSKATERATTTSTGPLGKSHVVGMQAAWDNLLKGR